jgi:hypothetical protein
MLVAPHREVNSGAVEEPSHTTLPGSRRRPCPAGRTRAGPPLRCPEAETVRARRRIAAAVQAGSGLNGGVRFPMNFIL